MTRVHLRRQVLEQKGEGLVNRFGINHMVIVQDKNEIIRDGNDFIQQSRQNRLRLAVAGGIGEHPSPFPQSFGAIVCKAATR